MNLVDEEQIDRALQLFARFCRYPKIVDAVLILTYTDAFQRNRVNVEEFNFATAKIIEDCDDFPTPADYIGVIKTRRSYNASLPNADDVLGLPAPNREQRDANGRRTHNSAGEPLVTREFHYARCRVMLQRFDAMDAARGTPPATRLQTGLRSFLEGIISREEVSV